MHQRLLRPAASVPSVSAVVASPGVELSPAVRRPAEQRWGRDFSHVRVHTDEAAARSTEALGAEAWTFRNHIAFARGRYAPGTVAGDRLVGHELTHVVQQAGAAPGSPVSAAPGGRLEQEAHRQEGSPTPVTGAVVQASFGEAVANLLADIFGFVPRLLGFDWYTASQLRDYLDGLRRRGPERGFFSDNKARACVARRAELGPYDRATTIALAQDLLDGWVSGADEDALLTLLRGSPHAPAVVAAVGRGTLWSRFSGRQLRLLQAMTMTAADAGEPLVSRLRTLDADAIREFATAAVDPAVRASAQRALLLSEITASVPPGTPLTAAGEAELRVNGVEVRLLPDRFEGERPFTRGHLFVTDLPPPFPPGDEPVAGPVPVPTVRLEVWSSYPDRVDRARPTTYGAGAQVGQRGDKRFHERAHADAWLRFVRENPPPVFGGREGMTVAQFNAEVATFENAFLAYSRRATLYTFRAGDCVGKVPTGEQLAGTGWTVADCYED